MSGICLIESALTEENRKTKTSSQGYQCPCQDSNHALPKNKSYKLYNLNAMISPCALHQQIKITAKRQNVMKK